MWAGVRRQDVVFLHRVRDRRNRVAVGTPRRKTGHQYDCAQTHEYRCLLHIVSESNCGGIPCPDLTASTTMAVRILGVVASPAQHFARLTQGALIPAYCTPLYQQNEAEGCRSHLCRALIQHEPPKTTRLACRASRSVTARTIVFFAEDCGSRGPVGRVKQAVCRRQRKN